jgi:ribosomal protein S18 acetylase RimI-like enzyme
MLMTYCERFLLDLGCPKVNLLVRRGNEGVMRFYEQLGYGEDAVVALGKRLIPDA